VKQIVLILTLLALALPCWGQDYYQGTPGHGAGITAADLTDYWTTDELDSLYAELSADIVWNESPEVKDTAFWYQEELIVRVDTIRIKHWTRRPDRWEMTVDTAEKPTNGLGLYLSIDTTWTPLEPVFLTPEEIERLKEVLKQPLWDEDIISPNHPLRKSRWSCKTQPRFPAIPLGSSGVGPALRIIGDKTVKDVDSCRRLPYMINPDTIPDSLQQDSICKTQP